jgi:hypothetical protein
MVTCEEAYKSVEEILPLLPKQVCGHSKYGEVFYRIGKRPIASTKIYRGRRRCVVGYTWNRPGANFYSGRVYLQILGYGDNWEEAVLKMKEAVKKLQVKFKASA